MEMSVKSISESDLNKQHCAQTLAGNDLYILQKYVEQGSNENILKLSLC